MKKTNRVITIAAGFMLLGASVSAQTVKNSEATAQTEDVAAKKAAPKKASKKAAPKKVLTTEPTESAAAATEAPVSKKAAPKKKS